MHVRARLDAVRDARSPACQPSARRAARRLPGLDPARGHAAFEGPSGSSIEAK